MKYSGLSNSILQKEIAYKALSEMLLKSHSGNSYWGYHSYSKLFSLSSGKYQYPFRLLSIFMKAPVVRLIGKYLYRVIATKRNTFSRV